MEVLKGVDNILVVDPLYIEAELGFGIRVNLQEFLFFLLNQLLL